MRITKVRAAKSCRFRKLYKRNIHRRKGANEMNNKASITALMSAFGRAFHAENEEHPVFADHLAKNLMTEEENMPLFRAISAAERSSLNRKSTPLNRHRRSCCASS